MSKPSRTQNFPCVFTVELRSGNDIQSAWLGGFPWVCARYCKPFLQHPDASVRYPSRGSG